MRAGTRQMRSVPPVGTKPDARGSVELDGSGERPQESSAAAAVEIFSPVGPLLEGKSALAVYGAAFSILGVVAAARVAIVPAMGVQAPLLPFGLAIFAVSYVSGLRPALLMTFAVPIVATLIFSPFLSPADAFAWGGHVALFLVLGCLVSLMMHRLQLAYRAQQHALASAKAGEEQLRLVTNGLPALIAYCGADLRYRFNNRAYEQWFGLEPDEITGKPIPDVLGAEAFQVIQPHIETVLAGTPAKFEAEVPYRDGKRYVSAHYVPARGSDGVVRGWFSLIEDITERRRAEQALDDARLRLSLAMRAGRSGTFDWDIVGNAHTWSDELLALHGLTREQFGGTHEAWLACVHPDDLPTVLAATKRALDSSEVAVDYRIRRRDTGEIHWLNCRGKVFFDAARKPIRMLGINIDITELKVAAEALRQADRHKDEFLAMLAHELRNPLTPLRNVAHILTDERANIDVIRSLGRIIERQVSTLARLVDDLLDVARIRRGLIELNKDLVDVQRVIDDAIETITPVLQSRSQKITVVRAARKALVDGDHVRLEQVVVNLLGNASKFSPESASIGIDLECTDSTAIIRVRDNGVGIDPQELPGVFDLFVQGDRSLDRAQGGLGIGLTLVKRITELHGGTVEAQSAGLGHGAEFVVRLPRAAEPVPAQNEEQSSAARLSGRRVLIVEDNTDAAESLQLVLSLAGHEAIACEDSVSAMAALEWFIPQWVFLDVGLPGLDGFALAGLIQAHRNGKAAHVYAITGYGRSEERALALASGFDGHFTKPVDPNVILKLLEEDRLRESRTRSADRTEY
jgi:PAS domain S-box-containing protein